MSESTPNLFSYEDSEPPVLREIEAIPHPHGGGVILGYAGVVENRDEYFVNAQRTRFGDGEKQDYYRAVGGYSMLQDTILNMIGGNYRSLFIEETDNDRVIEYDPLAFRGQGEVVEDVHGNPQWCLPVDAARKVWDRDDVTIHYKSQR